MTRRGRLLGGGAAAIGLAAVAAVLAIRPLPEMLPAAAPGAKLACRPLADTAGAEDFAADTRHRRLPVSIDDRRAADLGRPRRGRIAALEGGGPRRDLTAGRPSAFHPHGIDVFAAGGRTTVFVVNHPDGWHGPRSTVEVYDVADAGGLRLRRTVAFAAAARLNDVAAVSHDAFYVSNESAAAHGSLREIARFLTRRGDGSVLYFDGSTTSRVLAGLGFANGIAIDRTTSRLAVAASVDGTLTVGRMTPSGAIDRPVALPIGIGPDNVVATDRGWLVASHASLRGFQQHAANPRAASPSRISIVKSTARPRVHDIAREPSALSGTATAYPWRGRLFLGRVFLPALSCESR